MKERISKSGLIARIGRVAGALTASAIVAGGLAVAPALAQNGHYIPHQPGDQHTTTQGYPTYGNSSGHGQSQYDPYARPSRRSRRGNGSYSGHGSNGNYGNYPSNGSYGNYPSYGGYGGYGSQQYDPRYSSDRDGNKSRSDVARRAAQAGYNDGIQRGQYDRSQGVRRGNPTGHGAYQNAFNGFDPSWGYALTYQQAYRQYFVQGYSAGFGSQQSYGRQGSRRGW